MDEKEIHHYHQPNQGHVVKAVRQHLVELGLTQESIHKIAEDKIKEILSGQIDKWINTGKFDKLIVDAVASFVKDDRKPFEVNRYGYGNHIRDLIRDELTKTILREYTVNVTKNPTG